MIRNINILIVSHDALTPSLKKMYCLDSLRDKCRIEFLSLRQLFYGEKKNLYASELDDEFIEFGKINQFRKFLRKYSTKNTYIFLENCNNNLLAIYIEFLIRKYKVCKFVLFKSFIENDLIIQKESLAKKIIKYCNRKKLITLIINKFEKKSFHFVFSTGYEKPLIETKKFIPINSTVQINIKNSYKTLNKCVFIDQGYPNHPDLIKKGYHHGNEKKFIEGYNNFFDFIENKIGMEVIIAKHPRSSVPNNYFKGRVCKINETENLIKESRYVIAHFSLINNVAIQYQKPMLIIYNEDIKEFPNNSVNYMYKLSDILNVNIINIDNYKESDVIFKYDKNAYENYINNYITINPNKSNDEIIMDALIRDYEEKD